MTTVTLKKDFEVWVPGGKTIYEKGTKFTNPNLTEEGVVITIGHGLDFLIPREFLRVTVNKLPNEYLSKKKTLMLAIDRMIKLLNEYQDGVIPYKEKMKLVGELKRKTEKLS